LRLLLFSDLRLGADFDRTDEWPTFLRLCELASQMGVDAICGAGNLYREGAPPDLAERLRAEFQNLAGVRVFLAPGSQDHWYDGCLYGALDGGDVHVFRTAAFTPVRISEHFTLWGAAHTRPYEAGFFDGFSVVEEFGVHVALFHGSERTDSVIDPATAPFAAADITRYGFAAALVGRQPGFSPGPPYVSPGWATADQDGGPSAALVTIDDGGAVYAARQDLTPARPALPVPPEPTAPTWNPPPPSLPPRRPAVVLPDWVDQILDGPTPADPEDVHSGAVWSAFVRSADLDQAVLRAAIHAIQRPFDGTEAR
jgi:DNA repair protein SbcD/Mre11